MIYTIYTDGSYLIDSASVHGGIVFWDSVNSKPSLMIHVISKDKMFVDMNNVGGELIAVISAIQAVIGIVKDNKEKIIIKIYFDYKGIGEWANKVLGVSQGWKANKQGTQAYANFIMSTRVHHPNIKLEFNWVKGHSGDEGNILADKVASYDTSYCKSYDIPIIDIDE